MDAHSPGEGTSDIPLQELNKPDTQTGGAKTDPHEDVKGVGLVDTSCAIVVTISEPLLSTSVGANCRDGSHVTPNSIRNSRTSPTRGRQGEATKENTGDYHNRQTGTNNTSTTDIGNDSTKLLKEHLSPKMAGAANSTSRVELVTDGFCSVRENEKEDLGKSSDQNRSNSKLKTLASVPSTESKRLGHKRSQEQTTFNDDYEGRVVARAPKENELIKRLSGRPPSGSWDLESILLQASDSSQGKLETSQNSDGEGPSGEAANNESSRELSKQEVAPAVEEGMQQRFASFISPRIDYAQFPELNKHMEDATTYDKLRRDKITILMVTVVEIVLVLILEVVLIVTAPYGGRDGYDMHLKYVISVFILNYLIFTLLLVDALRSNNSVQLMALILIKISNSMLTLVEVKELHDTGPGYIDRTVSLAIAICVFSWIGFAAYSRLARRLQVRLKWTILVAIGGFNEQTQRLVGAYLTFDCVMKFCHAYTFAYVVNVIVFSISVSESVEIIQHVMAFVIYFGTTISAHMLGNRESRFFIIPIVIMFGLAGFLIYQGIQFETESCDFCSEAESQDPNDTVSFDFFTYLSLTLACYLILGIILSVYMYVSFYMDGFSGKFRRRLKGELGSVESLGLY
eukprot:comp11407_c0_seq1/m.5795 comp11407_c0_seq1/g.5795  ORF comp11407_c0_seq1/g.5795 comp11407_c0_seq1/m.5795 type:complete len:628 (-) comp11407_c0_seq1:35-1918(-)